MKFIDWYQEYYPFLYEIYYHILLPERKKLTSTLITSSLSFRDFCQSAYYRHGIQRV